MADQVAPQVRKQRNAQMRQLLSEAAREYQAAFLGQEMETLWESAFSMGPDKWTLNGLTDNYIRVTSESPKEYWNQITPVRLTEFSERGLLGIIHE